MLELAFFDLFMIVLLTTRCPREAGRSYQVVPKRKSLNSSSFPTFSGIYGCKHKYVSLYSQLSSCALLRHRSRVNLVTEGIKVIQTEELIVIL